MSDYTPVVKVLDVRDLMESNVYYCNAVPCRNHVTTHIVMGSEKKGGTTSLFLCDIHRGELRDKL